MAMKGVLQHLRGRKPELISDGCALQPGRFPRLTESIAKAISALLILIAALPAHAQLPLIRLDQITPLGGEAGSEVLLEIAGKDLEDVKSLHFDHPGLLAVFVKPNQFIVKIAANAPRGTHEVRAVGKYGISGGRLFAVSSGLTEVAEKEPNDSPDQAQLVSVNSAVNGSTDANGDDFYRFLATKGQRLTIDCQAFRLDSTLRATMTLLARDGRELLQSQPYYSHTDPLIDFSAPADGEYLLRIHDSIYRGGLPYRIIISSYPQIENAFPAAVVPGQKTEITLLGRNLPGGKAASDSVVEVLGLETLKVTFEGPNDPRAGQRFDFINHLESPSLNARGLQWWAPNLVNALDPVTLAYADAPITLEREPNDTPETAQPITLPTVIAGRMDKPGDADWYSFQARAGESVAVDLLCERLGMPGDLFVLVSDTKGNELTNFDDHGINFNSLAQFNRDPIGSFTVPANETYRLFIQDRYRKGGPRNTYVMRIGKPLPDFYPVVFHETPVDPSCPVLRQGGSAFYEICLNRRHSTDPVTIEAEGLPAGVSCPSVHVSPQNEFANVVFTATRDAPEWAGAIRLKAWATAQGKRIEREVRCSQRRWAIDNINTSRVCREICLAVRSTAPYALQLPVAEASVAAGAKFDTTIRCERHWLEFKGKIQVIGLNLPPGFEMPATDLPPDKKEVQLKFTVAENVPVGRYSIVVRGDAQVPFNKDPRATDKPNLRVADPSTPLTVVVTAPKKK